MNKVFIKVHSATPNITQAQCVSAIHTVCVLYGEFECVNH